MSNTGVPEVCPSANVINGSAISVLTVSTLVVVPETVKLPVMVKSLP